MARTVVGVFFVIVFFFFLFFAAGGLRKIGLHDNVLEALINSMNEFGLANCFRRLYASHCRCGNIILLSTPAQTNEV